MIDEVLSTLATGGDSGEDVFTFVDAFQMPKFDYDQVRKAFHQSTAKLSLHADAKSKTALYRDRFTLLQQRVLRQEAFTKPALGLKRAEDTQTAEVGRLCCSPLPLAAMHSVVMRQARPVSCRRLAGACKIRKLPHIAQFLCWALVSRDTKKSRLSLLACQLSI